MSTLIFKRAIWAILLFLPLSLTLPGITNHARFHRSAASSVVGRSDVCPNPRAQSLAFTDYSVKIRSLEQTCGAPEQKTSLVSRDTVVDDYSCSESKPCKNGMFPSRAQRGKLTGFKGPAVQSLATAVGTSHHQNLKST